MRRPSVYVGLGLLGLCLSGLLLGLALLLRHEPGFYGRAAVPPGATREQQSKAFFQEFTRFLNDSVLNRDTKWYVQFTETQVNSFFQEEFVRAGYAEKLLPDGISEPRIVIEQDRFRLGFRYGDPPWSTVVSVDFKVWLAPQERNVVVLQLRGLHAGGLSVSAPSLLEQLSETLRKNNVDVQWFRYENRPTAVLRFQSNQARPTVQLHLLELRNGMLAIGGSPIDPAGRTIDAGANLSASSTSGAAK